MVGKIAWTILSIFVLAIAVLAVYIKTGHGAITPVLSGSMRPGIHEGDVVVTQKVPVAELKVGDIIVFTPPDMNTAKVHRIHSLQKVAGGKIAVETKGDYNKEVDPWGRILMKGDTYRVAFTIPKIGWLVNGGLRWVILGFVFIAASITARWTWKYVRS